ncbi:MAG TPA: YceI family protein [Ignavibacteriaceae bacterium]|nr:YceI family protein [Ignavibacteriaceae bacterium]
MFKGWKILIIFLMSCINMLPQGFNLPSKGVQIFNLKDNEGRNQATFFSEARYENISGLSNNVWGQVAFDAKDLKTTLQGEVSISVSSLKTGIEKRDEHLQSLSWLNAEKHPTITFRIKEIHNVNLIEDNEVKISLSGEFKLRGRTKVIYTTATMKYLPENDITKTIMPGDLISIVAKFEIKLSDFDVRSTFIPNRVSDIIQISINIVGSDYK